METRLTPKNAVLYAKGRMQRIMDLHGKYKAKDAAKASSSNPTTTPTSRAETSGAPPQSAPNSNSSNN